MQILAVDIGTSTQEILLLDNHLGAIKMTIPSPSAFLARAIQAATRRGEDLCLTGVTMGGGPCIWAVRRHIQAGHRVYATRDVAHMFGDNLDQAQESGILIAADRDCPPRTVRLEMRDLDLSIIERTLLDWGIRLRPDALTLAVFDHGAAASGDGSSGDESRVRLAWLSRRIEKHPHLTALACMRSDIPPDMRRWRALAVSAPPTIPLMVMDPACAALLGGQQDPALRHENSLLMAHVGHMHTLAVHQRHGRIIGLFEHHTSRLSPSRLDALLTDLADGVLNPHHLAQEGGHGALILDASPGPTPRLAVTGVKSSLVSEMTPRPHLAVLYGDDRFLGCWGQILAYAALNPNLAPLIQEALAVIEQTQSGD